MTLLVTAEQLLARREIATGPLAPLATGLRTELAPLIAARHDVPAEKALLSRAGGRCDRDGSLLTYDPFDARHRCPKCGREFTGELHDRFRLYWHQLWLAERAVHGALLGVLLDDAPCRTLAADLLDAYAARYLDYPNRDNVLGPSRPFFSTYLESIWLLQLCVALDLLELGAPSGDVHALGGRVRDRLVAPSAALIASYDEGMSNRQVWNNAALLAAGALLGDHAMAEQAIGGASGLQAQLDGALLSDGSWYEGENYHLFAHRGLWYGVQIAGMSGHPLPPALESRFREGFVAPFRTLLPDLTFPSRRDSQYAVSVRQPRFAESCELGLARSADPRLTSMLARLYDDSVPRGETGRAASSADVERNLPGTGLTRADLSWRSLLSARAELPELKAKPFVSDLLPAQGLAILRREEGKSYVALDYGHSGGGHGHPDRLNLLLIDGQVRWFDDPGTGSYVEESLHWYRSTLAHTAPLVDGHSQPRAHGALVAFQDDGHAGWMSATVELLPGLCLRRSVVLLEDYLIDALEWEGKAEHEVALPLHGVDAVDAHGLPLPREAARIPGGVAEEDGFNQLRDGQRISVRAGSPVLLGGRRDGIGNATLDGWMSTPDAARWEHALAPNVPTRGGLVPLLLVRAVGRRGKFFGVWSWRGSVTSVEFSGESVVLRLADGSRDEHTRSVDGWRIERERTGRCDLEVLAGFIDARDAAERHPDSTPAVAAERSPVLSLSLPATFALGEPNYRRSEQSWSEAGEPRATVTISRPNGDELQIDVEVRHSPRLFVAADARNLLDNEPAGINGDGVQLYLVAGIHRGGWLLVPDDSSSDVRLRPIDGWTGELELRATWRATTWGWSVVALAALPPELTEVELDVIVNETAPGRARRRGQLVLSGAAGEFVYLRGDRHDPGRLLRFTLLDA